MIVWQTDVHRHMVVSLLVADHPAPTAAGRLGSASMHLHLVESRSSWGGPVDCWRHIDHTGLLLGRAGSHHAGEDQRSPGGGVGQSSDLAGSHHRSSAAVHSHLVVGRSLSEEDNRLRSSVAGHIVAAGRSSGPRRMSRKDLTCRLWMCCERGNGLIKCLGEADDEFLELDQE